jgi:hypothetical protein
VSENTTPVTLYAYEEIKDIKTTPVRGPVDKTLRYTTNLTAARQDVLSPLQITFNNIITTFDDTLVRLTDTVFNKQNYSMSFDSTRKILTLNTIWRPSTDYVLIFPKAAIKDTSGNQLLKSDTIYFSTKAPEDYGAVVLRFSNLDLSRHPVLQLVDKDVLKFSFALSGPVFSNKMIPPGEYELRILYDDNNNGVWDPGNYLKKQQPEKAVTLPQKLGIRANWDNERDISL